MSEGVRDSANNPKQQTFADHLGELRRRIMHIALVMCAGSLIGFLMHKQIEGIIQRPLGQTLYYSSPSGGLAFVMQIAVGCGLIVSMPLIIFEFMQFIRPSLKPIKTRLIVTLIISSMFLSVVAAVYVYFLSLPAALTFLTSFNSSSVKALISVSDYTQFIGAYILGAVIAFQLPLLLYFANKIRRFPPGSISGQQRTVIAGAVIVSGVITPTIDPMNQFLLAAPIIGLFEVGALAVWVGNKRYLAKRAKAAKAQQATAHVPLPVATPQVFVPNTEVAPQATVTPVRAYRRQPMIQDIQMIRRRTMPAETLATTVAPLEQTAQTQEMLTPTRRRPFTDIARPNLHSATT